MLQCWDRCKQWLSRTNPLVLNNTCMYCTSMLVTTVYQILYQHFHIKDPEKRVGHIGPTSPHHNVPSVAAFTNERSTKSKGVYGMDVELHPFRIWDLIMNPRLIFAKMALYNADGGAWSGAWRHDNSLCGLVVISPSVNLPRCVMPFWTYAHIFSLYRCQ